MLILFCRIYRLTSLLFFNKNSKKENRAEAEPAAAAHVRFSPAVVDHDKDGTGCIPKAKNPKASRPLEDIPKSKECWVLFFSHLIS